MVRKRGPRGRVAGLGDDIDGRRLTGEAKERQPHILVVLEGDRDLLADGAPGQDRHPRCWW